MTDNYGFVDLFIYLFTHLLWDSQLQGNTNSLSYFNGMHEHVQRLPRSPRQNGNCRGSAEVKDSMSLMEEPWRP